jgi:hypothetical protein
MQCNARVESRAKSPKKSTKKFKQSQSELSKKKLKYLFTREYTQCTAGYTFCLVVVVVGGGGGGVVATFNQTWHYFSRQLIKHQTLSET